LHLLTVISAVYFGNGDFMKAILWTTYGSADGLHLAEVEKPTPKDHEVLIRVRAATVTAGDCEVRSLKFPLWLALPIRLYMGPVNPRNKILGQELAGDVEAVGPAVSQFKPGDAVFAATGLGFGAYAAYTCLSARPEDGILALKPTNMTYEEAATIPTGGLEALHFFRQAKIQRGERVLINGAGGSIGTIAVQLAKYAGAEVTGVDSGGKLAMLRALGADHVIDYQQADFTKSGATYDVIFDVIGKSPFAGSLQSLRPNGRYLIVNFKLLHIIRGRWASLTGDRRVIVGSAEQKGEDLAFLKTWIEAGVIKAVVDRDFPLEQLAEAHRYVETGQKKGSVVIRVRDTGG
jgi:NADPH:quinone reductase-like Zn-dependent oxidoreductase